MKKIQNYIILTIGVLSTWACADFVEPAIPYNNFETGTYLKTVTPPAPHNFFDFDNAKFAPVLECHAIDKINNVQTVDVFVKHRRGNTLSAEQKLTTVDGSAFVSTPNSKWPRATLSINAKDALAKTGLTKAQVKGGDFIEYRLVLTTKDGKVFDNNNLTADVAGGDYYASPFLYRVAIVCPSELGGDYDYSTVIVKAGPGGNVAGCAPDKKGTVTFKATAVTGEYEISDGSFGMFECLYGDTPPLGSIRFTDACGTIGMKGNDRYGDSYSAKYVSSDSKNVTFTWTTTYGDIVTTTLTKKVGTFPPLN
jgi:hypothetical protein